MTGVAVNVTLVPAQTIPAGEAAMLTEAGDTVVMLTVIPVAVAVAGLAQATPEVIIQLTTSRFDKPLLVKVGLLVPAFTPLTCHW